jgi:hypothetical protein
LIDRGKCWCAPLKGAAGAPNKHVDVHASRRRDSCGPRCRLPIQESPPRSCGQQYVPRGGDTHDGRLQIARASDPSDDATPQVESFFLTGVNRRCRGGLVWQLKGERVNALRRESRAPRRRADDQTGWMAPCRQGVRLKDGLKLDLSRLVRLGLVRPGQSRRGSTSILAPRHLGRIGTEVGASDAMMDAVNLSSGFRSATGCLFRSGADQATVRN